MIKTCDLAASGNVTSSRDRHAIETRGWHNSVTPARPKPPSGTGDLQPGTGDLQPGTGDLQRSATGPNKTCSAATPCFTPGTLIATINGQRMVENLREGDRVITRDNGLQEIRWIGQRTFFGHDLARAPDYRPILIQSGALGRETPENDVLLSPNHRLLITTKRSALYAEEHEVFVAAKDLTHLDGVDVLGTLGVHYIHFMFDEHEVVLSNGTWTESFQPLSPVVDGVEADQRRELFKLFPELQTFEGRDQYGAARKTLTADESQFIGRLA